MKQRVIISIGAILLLTGTARYFQKISNSLDHEIQSYVSSLNYQFTANLDSVISLKKGGGYLICEITSGRCNSATEDSLNRHLTNFKRIRFLHFKPGGPFLIVVAQPDKFRPMDSVVVNSSEDKFQIFRNGKNIQETQISTSMRHKAHFTFWAKN